MNWLAEPLIDPQLKLSPSERRALRTAAWSRWMRNPIHVALYSGGLGAAILGFLFLPDLIEPMFGGHRWYFTLIWFVLYMAAIATVFVVLRKVGYAPCVYAELRKRGYNVCSRCGYLLEGLPAKGNTCPECGTWNSPIN